MRVMNISKIENSNMRISSTEKLFSQSSFSQSQFYKNTVQSKTPSFTGAGVFVKAVDNFLDYDKLIKIFDKHYDGTAQKLLDELTESIGQVGSRIHKSGNSISIDEKSFARMFGESAIFPVTKLPLMLLNWLTDVGRKIPGIKKGAQKLYDSSVLTKLRNSLAVDEKTDMLKGILASTEKAVKPLLKNGETLDSLLARDGIIKEVSDELYKNSNRFFNTATGNYNTAYERPFNRIVTGLIPASFLANDAYNLAVICGDDEKASSKEAESRKKQEISRVLTNAYIQLITLGSFTKLINSNAAASAAISAATVLVAETLGRVANHRPVFFLNKESAVKFNEKLDKINNKKSEKNDNSDKEDNKAKQKIETPKYIQPVKQQFKGDLKYTPTKNDNKNENSKSEKKTLITFDDLKKAIGILSVGGVALAFLKNSTSLEKIPAYKTLKNKISSVGDFFKNKIYNKLTQKPFEVNTEEFLNTMKKLDDAGLSGIANKYRDIAGDIANTTSFTLKNGEKIIQTKTKAAPYVDAIIQPFKFLISVVNLPYRIIKGLAKVSTSGIAKKVAQNQEVGGLAKGFYNVVNEIFGKPAVKKSQTQKDIFAYSIGNLIKKANNVDAGKLSLDEFKNFVQSSVQRSFNTTSQSKTSNTDLAMMTKLASSAVTSVFLIADNYNMVMLKSNGEDKENASQKAKERLIQRISGIFYQTLFMKWFNTTFESTYHKSLLGMASVSSGNTLATEFFTRKSIGMPLARHNYDELKALDDKNMNRKGFLGKYFKFMSLLTGKKPLGERIPKDKLNNNSLNTSEKISNRAKGNYIEILSTKNV